MDRNEIERLEEILVSENPWVKHYFDRVRFPNGEEGRYNRIMDGGRTNGVVILPFNKNNDLGLLNIYRYPVASWEWEIPRGYGEEGLSPEGNAARELSEEMNVGAENFTFLGSICPNSGLISSGTDVVAAHNVEKIRSGGTVDDAENSAIREIRFFSISRIKDMINSAEIKDVFTIAGLTLASVKKIIKL